MTKPPPTVTIPFSIHVKGLTELPAVPEASAQLWSARCWYSPFALLSACSPVCMSEAAVCPSPHSFVLTWPGLFTSAAGPSSATLKPVTLTAQLHNGRPSPPRDFHRPLPFCCVLPLTSAASLKLLEYLALGAAPQCACAGV